jgi:hypothetical protein
MMMDPRVKAVREDKAVGVGSCSSIDECMSDTELLEALDTAKVSSPKDAVKWARDDEGLYLDRACDARWGDDDDPQLQMKAEFKALCEE